MLTLTEVNQRIDLLPPHLRAYAATYQRQAYAKTVEPRKLSAAQRKVKEACRYNLEEFASTFFPHICTNSFNRLHREFYKEYEERLRTQSRGHRNCTAAPRGFSKSSGCATMSMLHACAYHTESFILYITNSVYNATLKVRDIRDELGDNEAFLEIYGAQETEVWNQGYFVTADVPEEDGVILSGVAVAAAGRGSRLRGKTRRFQRPTLIIIDDIEDPDEVLSELQRDKTHNFIHNDVLKLGAPSTSVQMWGTILHPASELSQLLQTPGWTRRKYQAVERFAAPESVPLWQTWRSLFLDLGNPTHAEEALAFFEAHEDAMLAGHQVLWPDRKPYYDLMVERLVEGESAFFQELQNEPLSDNRYIFDMEHAGYIELRPEGIVRADGVYIPHVYISTIVAYYDPVPDKRDLKGSDYAACPVVMRDPDGYFLCVDAYCTQETSTDRQIYAIVEMLWRWQVPLLAVESNGFQSLLTQNIREAIAQRAADEGVEWHVDLVPITNMKNKILRIQSLESLVCNRWLQFNPHLPRVALQQLAEFLPVEGAGKVDFPDALEGACRVARGLYDSRAAY